MDNFKITKTILENINEQNDRINECVDIVNGYTTDEETRVNQEIQRQENELRREEQYNNNENKFAAINEQLVNIDSKVNNFTYDNKEIPLVGQGVPSDVNVLMKKDFNNNKREYALGVEINANGSRGDHNIETAGGHKVAIYGSAHTGIEGKPYIWSFNTLAQADEGLEENAMVQGYELDVNNNQGDRYQQYNWDNGIVLGLNVTSGGSFPITCGIRVGGTGSHNLPYQGILIDGAKENAIMLLNNYYRGIQFAYANIETNEVLSLNKDQIISVTDTTNNSSSPLIRFLNKYTVLHTQGGGLMVTTKDGSKMLFEIREDGTVNVPIKLESAKIECPHITNGQGEIRPILSGDSAGTPTEPLIGQCYFDRTRGIPLFWNGVGWVKADGMLP